MNQTRPTRGPFLPPASLTLLLSSPSPPVSSFFTSPFLSPPRAACFSLLFLSSCLVPGPSSHVSFSLYHDLSCLSGLPSPAIPSFSPSLFSCPTPLMSGPAPSHLSSAPPGSPFHLPVGLQGPLPCEARWCLCGALSMGQLPWCRPCCPGCPGGQGVGPRGGKREEGGSTWPNSRQGKGVAGRAAGIRRGHRERWEEQSLGP